MGIRAYGEEYLDTAQRILGDAVDFAVCTLGLDIDHFMEMFIICGAARQFELGNPAYIAGMNGCELVRRVLEDSRQDVPDVADAMYLDKSPEFWGGWALAYYQWYSARAFQRILQAVPMSGIVRMYPIFHEMDVSKFVEEIERRLSAFYQETRLRAKRKNAGLTQAELSEISGIPLRQIRLFEQRRGSIDRAKSITLFALSKALHCRMEELLELWEDDGAVLMDA